ncbi:tail completion protein [Salmonella phage vB_SentM_Phi_10]|uniref:Sheath stabilizing and tail completion protein n=2 Tax=Kuttervirus Det7 TaxID=1987157 RepID=A0A1X9I8P5_9CAUD|nr:tail sheath stabilizer [Salmonella phage Det7]AJQ20820.1 sheath stabilizing and tail completion protein [Salmonella phage Det7]ANT44460.1 sheath stabilizing and tail completion protein [Salmonella phage vB_SenM-2]QFR58805.1 tail completion protein [Salmonella phage vB_SentM_Phi_10]WPJ70579.1 hypothetical protein orfRA148_00198c [Salmonella phage RA148]
MARPFEKYFYHESLLKYIHVFNAIMSDLKVKTERGLMEIPLHMAIGRRNDLNRNVPANMLPFATMSFGQFEINKQVTKSYHNQISTATARSKQRIPIIIDFEYNIRTKKLVEMLQVLEQIYSVFTPSIDCQIKDNDTLSQDQNVKIILTSHTISDNWEGDATESPHIDCTFNFQLHGHIYGEDYWVDDGSGGGDPNVIKEIIIEMSNDLNMPWSELPEWFRVDKDGIHHPED